MEEYQVPILIKATQAVSANTWDEAVKKIASCSNYIVDYQTIEKKEPEVIEMSFNRWVEDYKPIINPFNLRTLGEEVSLWDAYFFDSSNEQDLSVITRTSTAFVWTILKDSCNGDNPYKAFYEYFNPSHDFEQAFNSYKHEEDVVWGPHLSVVGYFIATKVHKDREAFISVKL